MAEWISLSEAIAGNVHDGDCLALEGFTHLIPFAAGHEIIRQRKRNLSLVRMTPDLIYDQMIGAGCAAKLTFSWGGNPGVGSLHRFRDAVEQDWPCPLSLEERSHSDLANAYVAGAANLPFAVFRGYAGSDLVRFNSQIRTIRCPFTGEELAATPSVRPDVTVIHAQKADRKGNVLLWGILGRTERGGAGGEAFHCHRRGKSRGPGCATECVRIAWLDGGRSMPGPAGCHAVVCAWLLRPGQRLLSTLGQDLTRSGDIPGMDAATCTRYRRFL
jgi:acyl CoA:acetate/3-ketoacid CoA transferase alpha subunit